MMTLNSSFHEKKGHHRRVRTHTNDDFLENGSQESSSALVVSFSRQFLVNDHKKLLTR